MKTNRLLPLIQQVLTLFTSFAFVGCITVNVNFPEAAVRQAADDYVGQLYKLKEEAEAEKQKSESKKKADKATSPVQNGANLWWISTAHADMGSLNMVSPQILEIQKREVQRIPSIDKFKALGLIGESAEGLLVIKGEPKAIQKAEILRLIDAENEDRKKLYTEVMTLNSMSADQLPQIRALFAVSFQSKSPQKTWIQDATRLSWMQK